MATELLVGLLVPIGVALLCIILFCLCCVRKHRQPRQVVREVGKYEEPIKYNMTNKVSADVQSKKAVCANIKHNRYFH